MGRIHALLVFVVWVGCVTGVHGQESLKAGICDSFFKDVPEGNSKGSIKQFEAYLKSQTDQEGEFVRIKDPIELTDRLMRGDLHLGVFHGYEYAWAKERDPKLKILILAVNKKVGIRCRIFVAKDSKLAGFDDLQGKSIAVPDFTRSFCKFYLERECAAKGKKVDEYFSKVTKPESIEDGLDDVVDGLVDAVIVDEVAVEAYKERKEVRFGKLKAIEESPVFPTGVVAYHEGNIGADVVDRFHKALANASKNPDGKQILLNWRMTAFENPPEEFKKLLADTLKQYPRKKKGEE